MVNKQFFILTLLILILVSCVSIQYIGYGFSLTKQNYNGDQLKINGFYYNEYYKEHYRIVFLYSNGILINYSAGYAYNDIVNSDSLVFELDYKKAPIYYYGLFQIKQNKVIIENWGAGVENQSYLREGKILNDTTFILYNKDGNLILQDEIYHFKQYSPKPDSTNKYIK